MDAPMAKGTKVRQVVKVIEGSVLDLRFDADGLTFEYLVEYAGDDGNPTERWFSASQIEAMKEQA